MPPWVARQNLGNLKHLLAINCKKQFFDPAESIEAAKNMNVLCGPRAPTGAEATPFRAEATGERSIYIPDDVYISRRPSAAGPFCISFDNIVGKHSLHLYLR